MTATLAPPPRSKPKPAKRLRAFGRRWWHQLTAMRTALLLLLALALAAIPGSTFPQRSISAPDVAAYYDQHPDLAPWLDRVWAFDVYTSPWFSAIYLLLMVSLVGCILPRLGLHWKALRAKVPDAPRRMSILPYHRTLAVEANQSLARAVLKQRRWRTTVREAEDGTVTISAEKGQLRETGNLLFHSSVIFMLVGVALGSLMSWYGNRILSEDKSYCNNLQQYDEYGLGAWVDETGLPQFCVTLDDFDAEFTNGGPTAYDAAISYEAAGEEGEYALEVNHPLNIDGTNVFLIGHGYTPVVTYTDRYGQTQTLHQEFLAMDAAMNSEGAFKFPDANVDPATGTVDENAEVGFDAVFVPTFDDSTAMLLGTNPELENPVLALTAYTGDLGLADGRPESVYAINEAQIASGNLEQVNDEVEVIGVGDSMTLPDGSSLTFDGVEQYAVLQVRHDPGGPVVLAGAILLLGGLLPALAVRRRRFWIRWNPDGTVETAGLNRNDYDGLDEECDELTAAIAPGHEPPQASSSDESIGSQQ
ncbi:cytochrome c biogenesis protein ResB [Glycomyces algeriensis]|uniref:Cytochrome c biogenesis protein n=1 Tax=Glycomyces algeriensis TaxID=256037 RepID=A0A9W6G7G6_9ACTN|nr:cytochrome c biogenesis protein ResB [Glycomyces algeriensis]MDA1366287.1 cytochrome c biogenesis protein ResB [Glycomyces algeriensis]MDR7348944.1 cytochrome c biogenesis protein [Glycomyces algeriensis]GLI41648.1 cytochrome c biogenesis protein [Glycomyces algeriensis]